MGRRVNDPAFADREDSITDRFSFQSTQRKSTEPLITSIGRRKRVRLNFVNMT